MCASIFQAIRACSYFHDSHYSHVSRLVRPGGGGERTLEELRIACAVAEMEREGGMSARVSPLVRVSDAGNLLGGAGFALPVVDTDSITVAYEDAIQAVAHLRRMGETNATGSPDRGAASASTSRHRPSRASAGCRG